jgi:hypothetical protein
MGCEIFWRGSARAVRRSSCQRNPRLAVRISCIVPPFDIFPQEDDGSVLWIAASGSMEEAEQIVAKAMRSNPVPHAIVSLRTGRQRLFEPKQGI